MLGESSKGGDAADSGGITFAAGVGEGAVVGRTEVAVDRTGLPGTGCSPPLCTTGTTGETCCAIVGNAVERIRVGTPGKRPLYIDGTACGD